MSNANLPPAPDGALIYTHPQGKTIYVLPDGSMACYKPDGKRGSSSATPAKLAAGHGGWELCQGSAPAVTTQPAPVVATNAYGLAPQLAESADIKDLPLFVTNDRIVLEQKLDGDRVMIEEVDGVMVARTRDGRLYTKGLPTAVLKHSLPNGIILDGELVGSAQGRVFWAFDLPVAPGVTGQPLHVRRAALEALRDAGILGPIRVVPQARTIDEKHELAVKALAAGYEGLMAKRVDSRYVGGGRTIDWLKVKFVTTVDCVVLDVRDDGKDSVRLGLVKNGGFINIGRASLIGKEKGGVINKGDVIEVRYLYVGAQGRLYQPTILRKRDDKAMHECTGDQLRHVNKSVLEAL